MRRSSSCTRSIHLLGCVKTRSLLPHDPVVDILVCCVFGEAVAFLNLAFKLFAASSDLIEFVIRKMTPLLLDLTFQLLPVSFDAIQSIANSLVAMVRQHGPRTCTPNVIER